MPDERHHEPASAVAVVDYPIDNLGDRPLNRFLLSRVIPDLREGPVQSPCFALFASGSILGKEKGSEAGQDPKNAEPTEGRRCETSESLE